MNKLFVLSVISIMAVFAIKVNAAEITVLETGYGTGTTIEEANKKALDDARMKVILAQPKATYADTTIINERAKYKVVTIPAQILSVEAMSAELNVHLPTDTLQKDVFIANSSKVDRLDLNKEGHPNGTTYQTKVEFRFRVLPSSDVDRAKFLKEYMEMKDFIKSGEFKNTPETNHLIANYKHIFKDIRAIQIVNIKGENWSVDDYFLSSQNIDKAVSFYKNNYLDALVNTYQDFEVSVFNSGIEYSSGYGPKKNFKYQVVTVKMNGGCDPISIKNMGNDAAGNLCDLYKTLPKSVKETIKRKGMNNGSDESFYDEEYLFNPLQGVKIMPTTGDKRSAPINYGGLISRNMSTSFFGKQEAVDTYSQETFKVVPMFIASAILNEPSATLTILIGQEGKYIDVPITSNTYLMGNKISVLIASNQIQGGEITADDISPILWNGKYTHPAKDHWKVMDDVAVVSLPKEINLKVQSEFLVEVRHNIVNNKSIHTGTTYGHEQEYALSSPINYISCNLNSLFFKKMKCPRSEVFLMVGEFPAMESIAKNHLKLSNIEIGFEAKSNEPAANKGQCWAYSFKTNNLEECNFIKEQHWSLAMGSTPTLGSGNPISDIQLKSTKNNRGQGGEIRTKTSTNPSLIW